MTIRRVVVDNSAPLWGKQLETDLNGTLSGLSSDFLLKADNLASLTSIPTALTNLGFTKSLGASGYVRLGANGLIIQWGTATPTSGQSTITFAPPFPNALVAIVATISDHQTSAEMNTVGVSASSQTGATLQHRFYSTVASGNAAQSAFWVALGY